MALSLNLTTQGSQDLALVPTTSGINEYLSDDILEFVFTKGKNQQGFQVVRGVCKQWKEIFDHGISVQLSVFSRMLQKDSFPFRNSLQILAYTDTVFRSLNPALTNTMDLDTQKSLEKTSLTPPYLTFKVFNRTLLGNVGLPVISQLLINDKNDLSALQDDYRQSLISFWEALKPMVFVLDRAMPVTVEEIQAWLTDPINEQQLLNINSLELNCPLMTTLPVEISLMKNLKSLTLNSTAIQFLPSSVNHLDNLESFRVVKTPLREIPESLGDLPKLKYLFLEYTKVTKLPGSIQNNTRINKVVLQDEKQFTSFIKPISRVKKENSQTVNQMDAMTHRLEKMNEFQAKKDKSVAISEHH